MAGTTEGRYHVPVLLDEVLGYLPVDPDGVYVDGTLGGGGHARALAARLGPRGLLVGIDRDLDALAACRSLEEEFGPRVRLVRGNYAELNRILREQGLGPVDGLLLDLGISSHQVDEGSRGFSFLQEGSLDMRMGPEAVETAADIVNTASEEELRRLFAEYGEEPRAARIARAIVHARRRGDIATTGDLAGVVEKAVGRRGPKHPATRVFQALRIAVNRELEGLDTLLAALPALLAPGGRAAVIAYHSLEDRRVKQAFRASEDLVVLTRKAVKPSRAEIIRNRRARSAKLRVVERRQPAGASQGGRQ